MGAERRSAFVQLDKDVSFQREWGAMPLVGLNE